jgi:hypothetical protein
MSENFDPVDRELARLPREVAPPRDLWPAIAHAIRPARQQRWPMALAAGIAGAVLAAAVSWAVLHNRPAQAPAQATLAGTLGEFSDPSYVAARAELEPSFHERLALLEPVTRARIEQSVAVIRRAQDDIRKALAADPASPVLHELLDSTRHDEIDLYEGVVRGTQPAISRT